MADTRITDLAALSTVADDDLLVAVDVTDATMSPDGTDKKVTTRDVVEQSAALPFVLGQRAGARPGIEAAGDIQTVLDSVRYGGAGEPFARKVSLVAGIYPINSSIASREPIVIEGETSFGTRLQVGASFAADEALIVYAKNEGGTSLLVGDDVHVPGYGLRHLGLDGNHRETLAHGVYTWFTNRSIYDDVHARWIKGTVFKAEASLLECKFHSFDTWLCGSAGNPVFDLYDSGTNTDGHNLCRWIDCRFALNFGDHLRIGSPVAGQPVVREMEFIGCVFHGMLDYFDAFGDTDSPVPTAGYAIDDEGNTPMRIVVENAQGVEFIGCRSIAPGRGMPNLLISEGALGASAINKVKVIGGTWAPRAPFFDRTVASVVTADDTISALQLYVDINERHHMSTGSKLQFVTGTPPAPLALSTDYYAIRVDERYFKVATSRANAVAGTAINLTDVGSGAISYRQADQGITAVDAGTDTFTSADHRLATEARIRFFTDGGSLPTGISASTDYFVIRVDKDNFKVATTRLNAVNGTEVNITTTGSNLYWIPQQFAIVVEGGDLAVAAGTVFQGSPNRAFIKLETVRANVDIDNTLQYGATLIEDSTGSTTSNVNNNVGGLLMTQNNTSLYLTAASGAARQAMRMTAGDTMVFGDITNAGHAAQLYGATVVDLLVNNTLRLRAGTAGVDITGYEQFTEIADPAAGAANTGRLYVRDNGSGKSQLCVRFNSGAVQVIATEP